DRQDQHGLQEQGRQMSEITPDTRDWADVLEAGCPDCGFTGTEDVTAVPATITEAVETWQKVLTRDDVSIRRTPGRWSDLEYAAHMRDVLDLFRRRTELMLTETAPTLDNFDADAVAIASDFEPQTPADVASAIPAAAYAHACHLSQPNGHDWNRRLSDAVRTARSPAPPRRRRSLSDVTRVGADHHRFARSAQARPLVGAGAGLGDRR